MESSACVYATRCVHPRQRPVAPLQRLRRMPCSRSVRGQFCHPLGIMRIEFEELTYRASQRARSSLPRSSQRSIPASSFQRSLDSSAACTASWAVSAAARSAFCPL